MTPSPSTPLLSSPLKPLPPASRMHRRLRTHLALAWAGTTDYAAGVLMLLAVVSLWVTSSFITSDLFAGGYNKPFLVTYLNTASFALYLLPPLYRRLRSQRSSPSSSLSSYPPTPSSTTLPTGDTSRPKARYQRLATRSRSPLGTLHPPLSHAAFVDHALATDRLTTAETARLALLFCGAWFAANWSLNKALEWTSVGSSTILASMSGFFTLAIGRIFHVESFTPAKLVAVSISFLGVLLVSSADSFSPTTTLARALDVDIPHPYRLTGDVLSLLSALFYSIYLILLKVRIGDERRVDMQLFFGFVGACNICLLWPVGVALHLLGWESAEWPTGNGVWAVLLGNMSITLVSDYLYVKAMLKTTPLVVTLGLSLTIPFALALDRLRGTGTGGAQAVVGAALVLLSFGAMGVEGAKEEGAEEAADAAGEGDLERGRGRQRAGPEGEGGRTAVGDD